MVINVIVAGQVIQMILHISQIIPGNSCWAPTQHGPNTGRDRGNGNGGDYSLFAESRGNDQGLVTLCYVAKGSGKVRSHQMSSKSKYDVAKGSGEVRSHKVSR